jgi:hypothetical protein
MVPAYEAAVAAGDCGRLSAEGFILFDQIHMATKELQENFWTKLTSMSSIWSRQTKAEVNYLPKADYWTHPTILEPDGSADHARAEEEFLTDHISGVMYPEHPPDVKVPNPNYAPPYVIARTRYGRFGTFDVEKMVTDRTSARPSQVGEAEMKDFVHEHFPAARYKGFHKGFVDVELWHGFGRNRAAMRRHAHSCLRIEVVVSSPPRAG